MAVKGLNFNLGARITGQSAFSSFQRALQAITAAGNSAKTSMRGMSDSVKSADDSMDVFQSEFARLQARFNPAAAEVRRLEQTMADLKRAQMLGAVSAEQYTLEMLQLEKAMGRATAAHNSLVPANGRWNRGLSDSNRAIQQAGFQINDFFIQVAGGQNIVLALTQQVGQLVQFFGAWGSVAGAALAIGGALYLMFGDVKTAVERLNDANDALKRGLSGLNAVSMDDLKREYGEVDQQLLLLIEHQREYSRAVVMEGARQAVQALADQYGVASGQLNLFRITGTGAASGIAKELGFSRDAMLGFQAALRDAQNATTFEGYAEAMGRVEGYLSRSSIKTTEVAGKVIEVALGLQKAEFASSGLSVTTGEVSANVAAMVGQMPVIVRNANAANAGFAGFSSSLSSAVGTSQGVAGWTEMVNANISGAAQAAKDLAATNMASGVAKAGSAALTLAQRLWNAYSAAASIASLKMQSVSLGAGGRPEGIDIDPDARGAVMLARIQIANKAALDAAAGGGAGGAGGTGGGTSPIAELRKDYDKLMAEMSPLIASTQQFRDANAEALAAFDAGNVDAVKSALAEATDVAKEFKSVADSIANAFMTSFSGILKGTKSVKDAATEMLNAVLDKTIELLMMPVFEGIAGFVTKGIFGGVGMLGPLTSHEGGGYTGNGARSGGLDGKGGFLSIMHPKETVTDHTRGGGQSGGGVTINVIVDGATGNGEIMEMVSRGVSTGLQYYDAKVLPKSLARVSANPRRT